MRYETFKPLKDFSKEELLLIIFSLSGYMRGWDEDHFHTPGNYLCFHAADYQSNFLKQEALQAYIDDMVVSQPPNCLANVIYRRSDHDAAWKAAEMTKNLTLGEIAK